jgi:hypothetical protein
VAFLDIARQVFSDKRYITYIAALGVLSYTICFFYKKKTLDGFDIRAAVGFATSFAGICGGISALIISAQEVNCAEFNDIRICVFIGGLCISGVAGQSIADKFKAI